MVAALRKAGKKVEYVAFPDEGHGFVRPENRAKWFAATEALLADLSANEKAAIFGDNAARIYLSSRGRNVEAK